MNDTQDFVNGVDFTSLGTCTPALLNELVSLGYPKDGKGLVIVTRDTALNQPDVPSPTTEPRWKDYIWVRLPHATASSSTPSVYAWNDNAVEDVDVEKWVLLIADVSSVLSDIVNLENDVASLENQIETINTVLYGNGSTDVGVVSKTNTALETANSASSSVASKLDTSALDAEATKLFVATDPLNVQSSTRKAVKACMETDLTKNLQSQIDTINGKLGISYAGNFARIVEAKAAGTNSSSSSGTAAGASVAMKRALSDMNPSSNVIATLNNNEVKILQTGVYLVNFDACCYFDSSHSSHPSANWQNAVLVNGTVVALGKSVVHLASVLHNLTDSSSCILSLKADDVVSLVTYVNRYANDVFTGGKAAKAGTAYEIFASITLAKVG